MKVFTPNQRKFLKGLSHNINTSVIVGKGGVSDTLIEEVNRALKAHELIKVKFNKSKDKKDTLAEDIANQTGSFLVSIIGNHIILFRQSEKSQDQKIRLPQQ